MTLQVFSVGFGRTGTMSLKLGLEELGLGPCHHMVEVVEKGAEQVPMWNAAHNGQPNFDAIYKGYRSAVDWPTAAFWRELSEHYPDAKIILSSRSAESWYNSFSQTILSVLMDEDKWPAPAVEWFKMARRICIDRSLGGKTDKGSMIAAFNAHEAEVKAVIPANNLLVHEAKEGWPSLCAFLGVPVPETPYPRTHSKDEFFVSMQKTDDM